MTSNFSEILKEKANTLPTKVVCHKIRGDEITFSELNVLVNKCCRYFDELGLSKGDIVTVIIPNSIASIILYFSCLRSGLIVNPCPSTLSESELMNNINFLQTDLLVSKALLIQKNSNLIERQLVIENDSDFINLLEAYSGASYFVDLEENDIACLYYSSGTTGNPKCVMYSHKNMVSLVKSIVSGFSFSEESIHLGVLPLGHTAITNYSFLPAMFTGSTMCLAENFNSIRQDLWKLISELGITYLQIVPTVLFAILATPYDSKDIQSNKSLKFIGCGSAPLSKESQINFYQKFKIKVANLYGLSETGPSHFDNPLSPSWKPGSIGYPLSVNKCKVFNENFKEVNDGEIGQIALKGDNVFIGYYKNDKAYKDTFYKDYFLTGDLGFKDSTGKFYFADRKKDLIIKGGVNIVPGEIEEVIFKLKDVTSVAVIGVPHKIFGEEIIAFVERKDIKLTETMIKEICIENLQILKRPNKILFVHNMPIGPSGKILKRELRDNITQKLDL